ncbi:hypothetical protein N8603_00885 [Verrucomicrobiales bacterium]|nr:hypothetical protein [Verrucomicrobiales bacterium]
MKWPHGIHNPGTSEVGGFSSIALFDNNKRDSRTTGANQGQPSLLGDGERTFRSSNSRTQ